MALNPGFGGTRLGEWRLASRYITGARRQTLAESSGIYGLYIPIPMQNLNLRGLYCKYPNQNKHGVSKDPKYDIFLLSWITKATP